MKLYLGIDGGGTRTRALLVDASGTIHGRGEAGPGNFNNVGLDAAIGNVVKAAGAAWQAAGQPLLPATRAFLGCAGIKSRADISRFHEAAVRAGLANADNLLVANDLHNALAGGLSGQPGIALIAGTGTNCLGRDATGKVFMCGGWGWLMDDAGGAAGLALAALRAVARAADGRDPPTALQDAVLGFFQLSEPNELLARLYDPAMGVEHIAALAPEVIRVAHAGDATAARLLDEGADALGELVEGACRELDFPDGAEVVLLGGCATSGPPYQPLVESAIRRRLPRARIRKPRHGPLEGAALNALRLAGVEPLPEIMEKTL